MGSLQELDHVGLMRPITKFATTVYHTERIPEILGMAFRSGVHRPARTGLRRNSRRTCSVRRR